MDGRAASQTITDRIPYLLDFGIIPVVVSAPTGEKDTRFPHYQAISPAPSGLLFEFRHILKLLRIPPAIQRLLKTILLILCLPFYLLEKAFIHLDSHWSWFLNSTRKALPLIKTYAPTLIYSTAGPSSTHLSGYLLHRMSGLPWLAELHDPLVQEHEPNRQRRAFHIWLENKISKHAAGVIFFTERALASASRRNPELIQKGHVLRPGANPLAFIDVSYNKRDHIHFGHFGSLDTSRNLSAFLEAIDELAHERPELGKSLCLDVFGADLDPISQKSMQNMKHPTMVNLHGRLERDPASGKSGRQRVVEQMRLSDVLLLIHGEGPWCEQYIPSKLYEYLLSRRPILGMAAAHSELDEMLKNAGQTTVPSNNREALKNAVFNLWTTWREEGLSDQATGLGFTVEETVCRLLDIGSAITNSHGFPGRGCPNDR